MSPIAGLAALFAAITTIVRYIEYKDVNNYLNKFDTFDMENDDKSVTKFFDNANNRLNTFNEIYAQFYANKTLDPILFKKYISEQIVKHKDNKKEQTDSGQLYTFIKCYLTKQDEKKGFFKKIASSAISTGVHYKSTTTRNAFKKAIWNLNMDMFLITYLSETKALDDTILDYTNSYREKIFMDEFYDVKFKQFLDMLLIGDIKNCFNNKTVFNNLLVDTDFLDAICEDIKIKETKTHAFSCIKNKEVETAISTFVQQEKIVEQEIGKEIKKHKKSIKKRKYRKSKKIKL